MKKIINLILILILALGSLKANAALLSSSEIKSMISKQVIKKYKQYTDAQLSVEVVGLPFRDLLLPDGSVRFVVKPLVEKFMPRGLEKVSVYVNGRFIRVFNAPIVVKAYQNVLVASCAINREKELTSKVVEVKKVEISNTFGHQLKLKDLDKHLVAKKYFKEGEVIDKRFVKIKPDILRNAVVKVIFSSNNLTISTSAKALSDGVIGDSICVMNKKYNKVYTGEIIDKNKVLVKI